MYRRKHFKLFRRLFFVVCSLLLCTMLKTECLAATTKEVESNNTYDTATPIQTFSQTMTGCLKGSDIGRNYVSGSTSASDEDWYSVHLNSGENHFTCRDGKGIQYYVINSSLNTKVFSTYFNGSRRTGYRFSVPSTGTYYVCVIGDKSSSVSYSFSIGGPEYSVDKLIVPCSERTITINSGVASRNVRFDVNSGTVPDSAVAYSIILNGVRSSHGLDNIRVTNAATNKSVVLGRYTYDKNNIESLNMKVISRWDATLSRSDSSKRVTLSPELAIYYIYKLE